MLLQNVYKTEEYSLKGMSPYNYYIYKRVTNTRPTPCHVTRNTRIVRRARGAGQHHVRAIFADSDQS